MGIIELIIYIIVICVLIKLVPYILVLIVSIYIAKLIWKLIKWIVQKRKVQNDKKYENSIKITPKKRMSQYDLERFAVECNAYLEHQDEMEQYREREPTKANKPEQESKQKPEKKKEMTPYELEQFARECNAYVVRREREENIDKE